MNDRPNDLLRIRPQISKTIDFPNMGTEERQNATLRPILKLQNPLLLAVSKLYREAQGLVYELGIEKRLAYMKTIYKDQKICNSLKGMIIGQFTVAEYEHYIQNSSSINNV